jgi:hypothetical protein
VFIDKSKSIFMKTILRLLLLLLVGQRVEAQITSSVVRAGFGVDGDLRANIDRTFIYVGIDDWYNMTGTIGSGTYVIDTTGAGAIVSRYAWDEDFRELPFFRTMRVPAYTTVNNRIWIDAVFIRDYHGSDSTIFASGSNKNGMTPADWTCPVAQGIPDKNDILDMFVHVRRQGANATDSLWMMGGLSIENTTGNRYFDFEMYQTDIYYDRPSRRFYGYGADAGHTAWLFDAAGNVTRPGDIIFTAEYSSNSLTAIEARIWVDNAALSTTPQNFTWTGSFDGANNGSQYGYAGILPENGGIFYTGLTCGNNTWAGPFSLVREDNSVVTNYIAGQFMEFSVNLTKLGLDPVTLLGGNACGMPFRRILVKSRASTSFTAELKDFVGPFDFFLAPRVDVAADIPYYCGSMGVSQIQVTNAVNTSVYTWTTADGHIVGSNTGSSITVDYPGTYIVTQQLASGCSDYANDTVVITYDANCAVLENNLIDFRGTVRNKQVQLNWTVSKNQDIKYFDVQRSTDGVHFTKAGDIPAHPSDAGTSSYGVMDDVSAATQPYIYYRLKITGTTGFVKYSKVIRLALAENGKTGISITPNPVRASMQINISSTTDKPMQLFIYDLNGKVVRTMRTAVQKGNSAISVTGFQDLPKGIYPVKVMLGNELFTDRMILTK